MSQTKNNKLLFLNKLKIILVLARKQKIQKKKIKPVLLFLKHFLTFFCQNLSSKEHSQKNPKLFLKTQQ